MRDLREILHRQFGINRSKNLLNPESELFLELDPMFLAAMERATCEQTARFDDGLLVELADTAADLFVEHIYALNQYIQINRKERERLRQIYLGTWGELARTHSVEATLRTYHYPHVRQFIESLYPASLRTALRSPTELGAAPCGEYSPQLQMRLLRLESRPVREPLLDVGCGSNAFLVEHLRSGGIEAYGFDRNLKVRRPYLSKTTWFDYEFGGKEWGTVVSNQAVSIHAAFTRTYRPVELPRYRTLLRRILQSLAVGGTFTLAPSDSLLDETVDPKEYLTESWPVVGRHRITRVTWKATD